MLKIVPRIQTQELFKPFERVRPNLTSHQSFTTGFTLKSCYEKTKTNSQFKMGNSYKSKVKFPLVFIKTEEKQKCSALSTQQMTTEWLPKSFVFDLSQILKEGDPMLDYILYEQFEQMNAKLFSLNLYRCITNQVIEHFAYIVLTNDVETFDEIAATNVNWQKEHPTSAKSFHALIDYIDPLLTRN